MCPPWPRIVVLIGFHISHAYLLCIHIRDEIRHRISDRSESLPIAVPRVESQSYHENGISYACSRLRSDQGTLIVI